MKKVLLLLGILAISMFLIGCVEQGEKTIEVTDDAGNLVGEALRLAPGSYKLAQPSVLEKEIECKQFNVGTDAINRNGYEYCVAKGYDTCLGGIFISRVAYPEKGVSNLLTIPVSCEDENFLPSSMRNMDDLIKENLLIDEGYVASDSDLEVRCCKIN